MRFLLPALLLAVASVSRGDGSCPLNAPYTRYGTCSRSTVVLLDATNKMSLNDINDEFQFVQNQLMRQFLYPYGQEVAFVSYGAIEGANPLTSNYTTSCEELDVLNLDAVNNGRKQASLLMAIANLYPAYNNMSDIDNVIIFSRTQDANDIYAASSYINTYPGPTSYSVVALSGNYDVWINNFNPDSLSVIIPITSLGNNQPLGACLTCNICNPNCDQCTQFIPQTTTMDPPTTTTTIRPRTSAAPAVPDDSSDGPTCTCNPGKIWIDVMVLVDISTSIGKRGLDELILYIQQTFFDINVQKSTSADKFSTRVGVITYNVNASVMYPLGSLDQDGLENIDIPYSNIAGTNIEAATYLAEQQFSGPAHRLNSRKFIMLMASQYTTGPYDDPHQRAYDFRFKQNGTFAVYNYIGGALLPDPVLQEIASPGYFTKNTDADNGDFSMEQAMCNANCYCPDGYQTWKNAYAGYPLAGCYAPNPQHINFQLSYNRCVKQGGYIAMEKNAAKAQFLETLLPVTNPYWAGMKWDSVAQAWVWQDNNPSKQTKVTGSYQPWMSGPAHTNGIDCVQVVQSGGTQKWSQLSCTSTNPYFTCERSACDSVTYCDDPIV